MWATEAEVLVMTGRTVSASTLASASYVIEIYANRTEDASAGMGRRDRQWLRSATAWQAAWQDQQPGFEQRSAVDSVTQDGFQVQHGSEWEVTLAPLARRALMNVSWVGSRTLRIPSVRVPLGRGVEDFLLESGDAYDRWHPLPGVS